MIATALKINQNGTQHVTLKCRIPSMRGVTMGVFFVFAFGGWLPTRAQAQLFSGTIVPDSTLVNGLFLTDIDEVWQQSFREQFCLNTDTAFWNIYDFAPDHIPDLDTALIFSRLNMLNAESPMGLEANLEVLEYIRFYATRRNKHLGRMLGMSRYYFPLFEEKLDKANLPLELKYLPIVESALNPRARSRVGATGLWQFMYPTGKMYGLEVNSYVDERMDPIRSTEAACEYLARLYSMYNDWSLALAAYNAGPGNVNKAIRRSGGKSTYWAVRPYLPKETRGYVPAFIAVNYLMEFHEEHNIYPAETTCSWLETDTLLVSNMVRFDQLAAYIALDEEALAWYNPTYRKGVIPSGGKYELRLPYDQVAGFIAMKDSIESYKPEAEPEVVIEKEPQVYVVRSGDVLGSIARKHGVSVGQLQAWNSIRGSLIRPGQKLYIYK